MEVIRAKVLGFCMGVRRAVKLAENTLKTNGNSADLYTLGPLIHNETVLKQLSENGLKILDSDSDFETKKNACVIIRAHGTTPNVLRKLSENSIKIIDATCPRVQLSQKRVSDAALGGTQIIIAGDKNHGEVVSLSGFAEKGGNSVCVVQNSLEAEKIFVQKKALLIAQTTFSLSEFEKIEKILKQKNPNLQVFNSICNATRDRQSALCELRGKADGILVVGGKNSANTKRLYETACSICKKTALIETESEIPDDFFLLNRVGLTAGASTPDDVINSVENRLLEKSASKNPARTLD